MDKNLIHALPKMRSYSLIEAVFSYQYDLDNKTLKSLNEYARIWDWSRTKVTRFLRTNESIPVDSPKASQKPIKFRFIEKLSEAEDQPETEKGKTEQRQRRDIAETEQRPEKLQFNEDLNKAEDQPETRQRPSKDQPETTTNNPNPNPEDKEYLAYAEILKTIPRYPFDPVIDIPFLQEKAADFPNIDISSLLKGWKTYLLDVPLKKKSRPRSQLSMQFDLAMKWGWHKKAAAITQEAPAENMLEIIRAAEKSAEKELEMETAGAGELI